MATPEKPVIRIHLGLPINFIPREREADVCGHIPERVFMLQRWRGNSVVVEVMDVPAYRCADPCRLSYFSHLGIAESLRRGIAIFQDLGDRETASYLIRSLERTNESLA